MFLKLPFGLTTAPWAFSRLMRPIKKSLRLKKIHVSVLNDFLIAARLRVLCALHTTWTADLLEWLGFSINEEKSERNPRQSIVYLGMLLNLQTMTLALPPEQVANVATQCNRVVRSRRVTRRQLEAVVGLLNFAGPMLQLGKLFLTPVIVWMNSFTSTSSRDLSIPVTASLKEALLSFTDPKFLGKPTSFSPVPGHFNGRLRLRLEWSDWSAQCTRFLNAIGSFKPRKYEGDARDNVFHPVISGFPG